MMMCVCETEIQAGRQMERVREGGRVRKKTEGGLFREEDREREKIYIYIYIHLFHFMRKKYCFQSCSKNYD